MIIEYKSNEIFCFIKLWVTLLFVAAVQMCCLAQDVVQQADSSKSVYIPMDLPDCMRQLDSILTPENKKLIQTMEEDELLAKTHFALGMWIRNNWGLWSVSRLATYFYEQGILHPDYMSGIILCCYYHYVKGENVNYRQMLRKGRQQEKRWAKKLKKEGQREDDDWEYIERYVCSEMDSLSEEAIEAFLHLPFVADSVTGVKIYMRNYGDSIAEDLRLIEQSLNRESRRTPRKDELVSNAVDIYYGRTTKGHVKSLEIKGCYHNKVKISFNPDSTIARFQHHQIGKDGQKDYTDEHYEYAQGLVSRKIVHCNDTLQSVTLYRFTDPCHCNELYFEGRVWNSLASGCDTAAMATSTYRVVLSPEGQRLAIFRNGCGILQYDNLGREVLWIDSKDGYTVEHCQVTVYDDDRNVYYEYQGGWGELYATVLNAQGDELGQCCSNRLATFDYDKTLYSYRYDRYGNWTRFYAYGKLYSRCKIRYY